MASTASMSNPPLFLHSFGLPPWLTPLQRQSTSLFSFLLDFNLSPNRFNVQSASFPVPLDFNLPSLLLQCPIRLSFSFLLHIYTNPSLKKFNFTPLLPTIFPSSPHHKNSRRDKPCAEHLRNIQTIKLYINYL